jgi:hypothetical protein
MSLAIYIKPPLSLVIFFTTNQGIPCPSSRQRAADRSHDPNCHACLVLHALAITTVVAKTSAAAS